MVDILTGRYVLPAASRVKDFVRSGPARGPLPRRHPRRRRRHAPLTQGTEQPLGHGWPARFRGNVAPPWSLPVHAAYRSVGGRGLAGNGRAYIRPAVPLVRCDAPETLSRPERRRAGPSASASRSRIVVRPIGPSSCARRPGSPTGCGRPAANRRRSGLSINTLAGPAMDTFQRRTWWRFRHHSRITHLGTLRPPVAADLARRRLRSHQRSCECSCSEA